MSRLEEIRGDKTFAEYIGALINDIGPFKQMWPFYWLKAAAVCDSSARLWRLCYFALIGRWSNIKPIREICDKGDAILAISQLIDADKAWELLASLRASSTVALLPDVTALALADVSSPTRHWQVGITFQMPKVVSEVAESAASWRYLYVYENRTWIRLPKMVPLDDYDYGSEYETEERMRQISQPDLNQRGLSDFESFTSTRLGLDARSGPTCSIRDFLYHFDLPLALRIERGIPDRSINSLPLAIDCRRPLTLETLKVSVGNIWLSNAEALPISIESSSDEGWSVGEVIVPYNCGKIWFKSEQLGNALPYEWPIPTPEDQINEVLGGMYHANLLDEGKLRWKKRLLESDGTDFEIALLNAIARFGIPVLFAGQVQQQTGQPGGGGTSTMGYDLVALDYAMRRAVLISAKGSRRVPTDDDCQKLLDSVESVEETLQGWHVTGLIACHASDNRLGRFKNRTGLRVWSREDLGMLCQADKREAIEFLLWAPPDSPISERVWNFMHGRQNF